MGALPKLGRSRDHAFVMERTIPSMPSAPTHRPLWLDSNARLDHSKAPLAGSLFCAPSPSPEPSMTSLPPKGRQGFASMPPEKVRAIAKLGGAAVPPTKRSFTQNRDLARTAGAKGGRSTRFPK